MLESCQRIGRSLHERFPFHIQLAKAVEDDMHMNVSSLVVTVCMGADNNLMAGKMFLCKLHSQSLSAFRRETVILFVAGIKTDDVVVCLDFVTAVVFAVLPIEPGAFAAICFRCAVDAFHFNELPSDHLSVFIEDRLVREFIVLKFEVSYCI